WTSRRARWSASSRRWPSIPTSPPCGTRSTPCASCSAVSGAARSDAHRIADRREEPPVIDALRKITSPSVANAIETFNLRPRNHGQMSSDIKTLFPELGPLVGYAVTALIRAEPQPLNGHRASTYGWWDYVLTIPAPRVIVVHDLDEPRGQGAQW